MSNRSSRLRLNNSLKAQANNSLKAQANSSLKAQANNSLKVQLSNNLRVGFGYSPRVQPSNTLSLSSYHRTRINSNLRVSLRQVPGMVMHLRLRGAEVTRVEATTNVAEAPEVAVTPGHVTGGIITTITTTEVVSFSLVILTPMVRNLACTLITQTPERLGMRQAPLLPGHRLAISMRGLAAWLCHQTHQCRLQIILLATRGIRQPQLHLGANLKVFSLKCASHIRVSNTYM
jgi:hypothetical protein